jgi:hypothetical protein
MTQQPENASSQHVRKVTTLTRTTKMYHWLMRTIHLQCALTALSLPLLVHWGIPLSYLTCLGNIIFTPFLFIFLLLSSLIFLCELTSIPNSLFIYLLSWVQTAWKFLVSWSSKGVLLELPAPDIIWLWVLFFIALALLHYKQEVSFAKKSFRLLIFICISCITLRVIGIYRTASISLSSGPPLTLIRSQRKTICVDRGTFKCSSMDSWITYTLFPELRKNCGTSTIDLMVITKPSAASCQLAQALCAGERNKTIILPQLGYMPPTVARSMHALQTWATESGHTIIRIDGGQTLSIAGLTVTTSGYIRRSSRFIYPALKVVTPRETIVTQPTIRQLLKAAQKQEPHELEQHPAQQVQVANR